MKRPLVEWLSIVGAPSQAWVTWARRRAQWLYESGIRPQQRLRMADGTEISILLVDENAHIRVSGGGSEFRYQFITTLQENSTYSSDGFTLLNGSAVSVRFKVRGGVLQYTAEATGSTLEALPDGTEPISSVRDVPRVKAPVQVQLIPEPIYTGYSSTSIDTPKKYTQLLHSWASVPGVIYNAGFYMPGPAFNDTDKGYDAAPSLITDTTAESRMPDADWPHSACIVTVDSESFGSRRFIVMVDASSMFYCWPTTYENAADEYLYPVDSPYIDQAIKTNVAAAITQSLTPPFPAWVYVPVGHRRDTDWPVTVNSGEPRYGWKFHPLGTHVVGTVLSRTAFAATVKGRTTSTLTYLPFTEVDIDELKINPSRFSSIRGSTQTYDGDLQYDLPGWVEFSLNIVITGPNPEDFTFGMTLTREQAADATHYPIAADYLHPVLDGWATYGVDGTPGDLVVLDLASYVDDRGLTWIARNCGYLGDTEYKVRQTWATVHNVDASNSELLRFPIKDQPSDFDLRRYDLDAPEMVIHAGRFVHIDLARLSFVYFAQLAKYTVDASDYAHGYTSRNPTTGTMLFGCRQRWESSETGLRYIVFGKIVHEVRGGNDFGLWDAIDGLSLAAGLTRFSPVETGTRWLTYATANEHRRHWLISELEATSISGIMTFFDRTQESGYISDGDINRIEKSIVLRSLSKLSSSTSGTEYHDGEIATASSSISFSGNVNLQTSPGVYEYHPGTPCDFIWDKLIPTFDYDIKYTSVDDELATGCSTIDSGYISVLTDWINEAYHAFLSRIEIDIGTTSGQYTLSLVSGNHLSGTDPLLTYDGSINGGELHSSTVGSAGGGVVAYSNPDLNIVNLSQTGPAWTVANSFDFSYLSGYGNSATNKFHRSLLDLLYKDEPIFYSYYDYIFETYNATNKHHRVHDYPIGAEWMLREWFAAVEVDANFSLVVCPEGFYAGHVWLPSISGHIAKNTLLVNKDYAHEPYFMPAGDPYVSYHGIQATHVIKSDVIPCLNNLGLYYVYYNVPTSSQLAVANVDVIGHVSGWKISHASAYQTAYQHVLDIADPSVRFTADTAQGYVYEKGVNYDGDTLWSDLMNKVSIFNAPRKNGAMLFSK